MVRVVDSIRWNLGRLLQVHQTPLTEQTRALDLIESDPAPHEPPPGPEDVDVNSSRRAPIMPKDLEAYG